MADRSVNEVAPVSFGEKLASSPTFAALFREGMGLVEETAAYLDGPGRQQSKQLERAAPRLRHGEHALDHAPDATRVVALAAPRRQ